MSDDPQMTPKKKGFAAMDKELQQAIARKGGLNVPAENRTFSRDRKLAVEAGRKGGTSVRPQMRSFSQNKDLASRAGRKGGSISSKSPDKDKIDE